ncbi:MAG: ATP-binding protein [Candidatus Omnitrophica bacterium]|nr:ATP-binding protein [Candidatus Omnitrophota bacterium]
MPEVQKASARVLSFLKPLRLNEGALFDVRLSLEEAVINAIKYGHCLDRGLRVRVVVAYDPKKITLTVEDQGEGFDPKKVEDCTKKYNLAKPSGRGVYLIHQLMDKVRYNAKGNRLEMVKFLKRRPYGN